MARYDSEVTQAIARWAPSFGVKIDPAVVHAIIEQESRHGLAANYVKNAGQVPEPGGRFSYGPMQVLESTARELGAPDPRALINPAVGISYGVKYLAGLLKRFKGDVVSSISAYNAGPGGVGRNPDYIKAVLSFLGKYRQAAAPAAALLALAVIALLALRSRRRLA